MVVVVVSCVHGLSAVSGVSDRARLDIDKDIYTTDHKLEWTACGLSGARLGILLQHTDPGHLATTYK